MSYTFDHHKETLHERSLKGARLCRTTRERIAAEMEAARILDNFLSYLQHLNLLPVLQKKLYRSFMNKATQLCMHVYVSLDEELRLEREYLEFLERHVQKLLGCSKEGFPNLPVDELRGLLEQIQHLLDRLRVPIWKEKLL